MQLLMPALAAGAAGNANPGDEEPQHADMMSALHTGFCQYITQKCTCLPSHSKTVTGAETLVLSTMSTMISESPGSVYSHMHEHIASCIMVIARPKPEQGIDGMS